MTQQVHEQVQHYYGEVLKTKQDLQTTACCPAEALPHDIKSIVSQIHPEIISRFYGCGVPLPSALEGCTVLDLGCGTGRDVYVLSKLVGPKGRVIGIDMTDEQLNVARSHLAYQMEQFGYKEPNVTFKKGFIEDLKGIGIEDESVDLVVSNCVFNLSPDKRKVFSEVLRVLKPGGELYFSDVFSDRRLSEDIQADTVLRGECLGGALYTEDFRRLMHQLGCADERTVSTDPIEVTNPAIREQLGLANFTSQTKRVFKIDIEDRCEDYGQVAYYKGTIPGKPNYFDLDDHHRFETNRPLAVCSNTAAMLEKTRFAKHFRVEGDTSTHYGLFDCGPDAGKTPAPSSTSCC